MRRAATAVIVAACGSGGGGAMLPGVSDVEVEIDRHSTEAEPAYYLNLHYHYRATRTIDEDTGGLRVRAACQVGALRFADDGAHGYDIERGKKSGWSGAAPFVTNELPDKPSMCEIRFAEQAKFDQLMRKFDQLMRESELRSPSATFSSISSLTPSRERRRN